MASQGRTATEKLCECVREGRAFDAGVELGPDEVVDAETIRRLVLSLPLADGEEAVPVSPAGIAIHNAKIKDRLDLCNVRGKDGGPAAALEFVGCDFAAGFSGACSHFSRLAFPRCRFGGDAAAPPQGSAPTIDLTDATLDCTLNLRGVEPHGDEDLLWIRAPGVRIEGHLDASQVHLRAPQDRPERLLFEPPADSLNIAGADIRNDFYFVGGSTSEGRISARNARIRGDVWMSGATIENPGETGLFFQGATIDGLLILDGRPDQANNKGEVRQFRCNGGLNMIAAEVGHDFELGKATILGDVILTDLSVANDLYFSAYVRGRISLVGCRIGGTLDLSDLMLGDSSPGLDLTDGNIGRSLRLIRSADNKQPAHGLLKARQATLKCMPGTQLVETLWDYEFPKGPRDPVQAREPVQVGFLIRGDSIHRIDGLAGIPDEVLERFGYAVDSPEAASEYLRLHCTYGLTGRGSCPVILGEEREQLPPLLAGVRAGKEEDFFKIAIEPGDPVEPGLPTPEYAVTACVFDRDRHLHRRSFRIVVATGAVQVPRKGKKRGPALTGLPRFEGPLIRHPKMDTPEGRAALEGRWVTAETVGGMEPYKDEALGGLRNKLAEYLLSNVSLRGEIRLTNLTCAMLDDNAGRHWGDQVRIEMDHFVYHRASWGRETGRSRSAGILALYWRMAKRATAEWVWVRAATWFGWNDALRLGDHWTTWQIKRNWIYRQFDTTNLPSPARYRIGRAEYRPQPFEQAIKVARAEGREDFATEFEMLKHRIEWKLFNRRVRWPLAFLAIVTTYWWLWHTGGHNLVTDLALAAFIGLILFISPLQAGVAKLLPDRLEWLVTPLLALMFAAPGMAVYFLAGWRDNPLHFFVALAIFGALRLISSLAHGAMRFMFGYLRRPVRAICTLVGAFLIGWAGVHAANERQMMVIDAAPVAGLVAGDPKSAIVGSQRELMNKNVASDIACGTRISEPLYALDVLIPLIDLRQESQCEVGRAATAAPTKQGPEPDSGIPGLWEALATLTLDSKGFWAVMKALYAIAGWFIVSLSILTFATTNRARAEPS